VIVTGDPLDQNPAAVYLAGLKASGRRSMKQSLDLVAGMLSNPRSTEGNGKVDAFCFHGADLRFQHTAAIRSKLMGTYGPATANRILCAIRGTLKAAWRLRMLNAVVTTSPEEMWRPSLRLRIAAL